MTDTCFMCDKPLKEGEAILSVPAPSDGGKERMRRYCPRCAAKISLATRGRIQ